MPINIEYTHQQLQALAKPLMIDMAARVKPEEMALIEKAFNFACQAHAGQYRKSGEPYIIHPIAVASIVGMELQLGTAPVCAAFLHDVVEDTKYTTTDIIREFGKDVAFLVDAVTKNKNKNFYSSLQVEAFGHLLASINYDIRALLIKLADRLHNMRTLQSMKPEKQMKIAGETEYFYAPLANRLGLYRIKIELENLSFRYRCPREYERAERMIAADEVATRPMRERFMQKVKDTLKADGIEAFVETEYRRPFSIRRKMIKTGKDFKHLDSRYFVRVVFPEKNNKGLTDKQMALRIYALLTDVYKEQHKSIINYIDAPKENGYESLHVNLLSEMGTWIEVHISSESMRRVSRMGVVAQRNEGNIERWIERLRVTLADISSHKHEIDFMEGVTTSFYNDDITAYTPSGQAVILPQHSTALDFAFELGTNTGLHAQYARINGKLVSVKTPLSRGDCVEIGVNPRIAPKDDWLEAVHTFNAKRDIREFINKRPKPDLIRCPHCSPLPGDEVIGYQLPGQKTMVHKRDCAVVISEVSQQGDYVKAVEFNPDATLYPVHLHITGVDRFHLLSDIIECISNTLRLSMNDIRSVTEDEIVRCDIDFAVHSSNELTTAVDAINEIPGVEQVSFQA